MPAPQGTQSAKLFTWLAIIGGFGITVICSAIAAGDKNHPLMPVGGLFGVIGIIGIVLAVKGFRAKCPKCSAWWGKVHVRTEAVKEEKISKIVTRKDTMTGGGVVVGRGGLGVGAGGSTTNRQERDIVLRQYLDHHFLCNHCGQSWVERAQVDKDEYKVEG